MMRWAFLDDALAYTGATLRGAPMGGIQAATVQLAEALAARGHTATVYNRVGEISQHYGVTYAPLEKINTADVVVANCAPKLFSPKNFARHFFSEATQKTKKILWMHGPASYMQKPKHLWPYILHGPRVVFSSHYQRRTWPAWLPQQSVDIPLGLGAMFLGMAERQPPPPVAIFLSNPRRGLDWLVNLWQTRVFPVMPAARLHVYGGRAVYGNRQDGALDKALSVAENRQAQGIHCFPPVPRQGLVSVLQGARVMVYRGDAGETFCLAAAEAQAAGVPLVTQGLGCLAERVRHGETGFVAADDETLAAHTLALLRDDGLWRQHHRAALTHQAQPGWGPVAERWERVVFSPGALHGRDVV